MIWKKQHEEMLCREILTYEPFNFKSGTVQRGEAWKLIAESLNMLETPKYSVNNRSVRERYAMLERNYKQKIAAEEKATGISPEEPSDLEKALEEIVAKFKEIEMSTENKKATDEKERETATEMRRQCMETFRETEKRKSICEDDNTRNKSKKKRRSGDDTIQYLRDKMEVEKELRQKELEIAQKREETMQRMILQQQQQNEAMLALLLGQKK